MSSITTTTTTQTSTLSILSDYEIHHTGETHPPQTPSNSAPTPATSQPVDWPSNYRRVPPYRTVNRNLDYNERAAGASPAEYVFIQSMLHGVWLNAVSCNSVAYAYDSNIIKRLFRVFGGLRVEGSTIRYFIMRLEGSGDVTEYRMMIIHICI